MPRWSNRSAAWLSKIYCGWQPNGIADRKRRSGVEETELETWGRTEFRELPHVGNKFGMNRPKIEPVWNHGDGVCSGGFF